MAHASFVTFLRRNDQGYAQAMAINAIGAHAAALKYLELMCADRKAELKVPVETYNGPTCLEDLRNEARSLAQSLPQLRGGKQCSDRQAAILMASLIDQSIKFGTVAETYPTLAGAQDLEEISSALDDYATGLDAIQDAHSAGVAEGIKSARRPKGHAR